MELIVPVMTKFDSEGNMIVDDDYRNFIRALVKSGVDVVMPCGTNGEFHVMGLEERKALVRFLVEEFGEYVDVMPHVGSAGYRQVRDLIDHSASLGIKRVSVVVPYYFKYDSRAIEEFFVPLAKEFEEMEFVMYNIPSFSGNSLSLESIIRIKERANNVVGLKDTASRPWIVSKIKESLGEDFKVYGGNDSMVLDYLARGADGHVSGTANVFPKLLRALLDSFESGDLSRSVEYQKILDRVFENITGSPAFVAANKYVLKLRGYDLGFPGRPNRDLDDEEKDRIEAVFKSVEDWAI